MSTKTMIALAAMLMVGVVSAAQAGSKDDSDPVGGYKVGPLGQSFNGGATAAYGFAGDAFASVKRAPGPAVTIKSGGKCWLNTTNGNYAWAACR
jgi:hypothetical protein